MEEFSAYYTIKQKGADLFYFFYVFKISQSLRFFEMTVLRVSGSRLKVQGLRFKKSSEQGVRSWE